MKYLDRKTIYIPIAQNTTKEEISALQQKHADKTVIFLRSGDGNMKKILLNFIAPR